MASTNLIRKQATVYDLDAMLQNYDNKMDGINEKHHFAPGVYAREVLLPAGSVVVGKTHKTKHLNIIASGHCTIHCMGEVFEVHGPYIFTSEIGAKKAVYSHTDVVWINIHLTDKTDVDEIEKDVIDGTAELEFEQYKRLR